MKKIILPIILLMVSIAVFAQSEKLYKSKSGKIVYQYEFDDNKSTYSLLFDDYGKKQVIDIENLDGSENGRVKTIMTSEAMFVVNYEDKQVIKIPIEMGNPEMYGAPASGGLDLSELVAEVTGEEQYKSGKEMVAGKNCDVYNYKDTDGNKGKYWIWNGYLLKADFIGEDGEHAFMQVKELKLDIAINDNEFDYPSGFELNDMTKMMEQMNQLKQMYGSPDDE